MSESVLDHLNGALRAAMEADERVFIIGEDVADPYGGAFKATRGLSTAFPDRVISTPISELGIAGVANGLALAGQRPILEFMFGDFIFLAFDQIVNFAAKSVGMYGQRHPFHLVIRCPVGGHRGYGATHSQSVQKHFMGVPDLALFELSSLHDCRKLLPRLLGAGIPCLLFEPKALYGQKRMADADLGNGFRREFLDADQDMALVSASPSASVLLITSGGSFSFCLTAAQQLQDEEQIDCAIAVAARIYPWNPEPLRDHLRRAMVVFVVEESGAGGTWGAEVAATISRQMPEVRVPIQLVHSADSIIPAARHLEREVLVSVEQIKAAVLHTRGLLPRGEISGASVCLPVRDTPTPPANAQPIIVPAINANDADAVLVSWEKPHGAEVRRGALLAILETSKVCFELMADHDGILAVCGEAGKSYPFGATLGWIRAVEGEPSRA